MIWFFSQGCVKEWFARGPVAMRIWLDSHEDGVDFCELLGIVAAKCPAAVRFIVHEENAEIHGLVLGRLTLAPDLECAGVLEARLAVQIKGVKNERFPFRVENTPVRLAGPAVARHVEYVCDVELPRAHQLANIAICREILSLIAQSPLLIPVLRDKIVHLPLQRNRAHRRLFALCLEAAKFGLNALVRLLRIPEFLAKGIPLL